MHALVRFAFAAATLLPAAAHADIVLKNLDGTGYRIAIRHAVATTTTMLPARSALIVTEGARTIQIRGASGEPKGDAVEVADGDRLEVKGGRLRKTDSKK